MKINWKARLKNHIFILNMAISVIVPLLTYYGVSPEELDTWSEIWGLILHAIKNPYILFTSFALIWNNVIDPTTKGISDSKIKDSLLEEK